VAKEDVLARVKQDLVVGHTYLATQRLRTLISVDPQDTDVRLMLAAIYRQTGNLVEAGRWSFLTGHVLEAELTAFERANPSPWLRLRMLAWNGDPAALPEGARERLLSLVDEAERSGPPNRWFGSYRAPTPRGTFVPCLFVTLALLAFTALAAVGTVRLVGWVMG
jgi:hypothetical protein